MQDGQNAAGMGSVDHLMDKEVLGVGAVVWISTVPKSSRIGLVPRMTLLRSGDTFSE